MTLRRTYLRIGRRLQIHCEDFGQHKCRLLIHGWTESGATHEVVLSVDSLDLAGLVERIRDHFEKLAANEAAARMHRERALRMPAAGGGA